MSCTISTCEEPPAAAPVEILTALGVTKIELCAGHRAVVEQGLDRGRRRAKRDRSNAR